MAIKYIAVTFFFQLVVMLPVHHADTGNWGLPDVLQAGYGDDGNSTTNATVYPHYRLQDNQYHVMNNGTKNKDLKLEATERMLWLYTFFVYLYSGYALYLIITETRKVIRVRQSYLGSQSTITDRTIRLSGIPEEIRSEEKIKDTVEDLGIGKVESVLLVRDWREIDEVYAKRKEVLRRLETAWAEYLGSSGEKNTKSSNRSRNGDADADGEGARLLDQHDSAHKDDARPRPQVRIWFGFMGLQTRKIDAIDYYEEKLRKLSDAVTASRRKVYKPMPVAFVTMDTTATAQMAIQALMDPEPMQLLAKKAPAPGDILWPNTYLSRTQRMSRAWSITLLVFVLTAFWVFVLVFVAGLLSVDTIGRVWPQLRDALVSHQIGRALVTTLIPTLIYSGLAAAVPYLYYYLSTYQGMMSQGEIEISLISKNFFFTFFNLFIIFTLFGTFQNASQYFGQIRSRLRDTLSIAYILARSLKDLVLFYMNLIILQGLGLYPFRLLEFGSVFLYPFYKYSSSTPRDYADLVKPPVFSYGFYLPQVLLIYIICIVYSVLPGSWFVLFFGLLYFLLGAMVYKYQLLYAMDHRQHSTGRAWSIICNRIVLGLLLFQLAMAGILGLSLAFKRAILIVPLLAFTLWFIFYYQNTYEPLMKFIAIRSLKDESPLGGLEPPESRYDAETVGRIAVDESDETGLRYMNPSLVLPLEEAWLPEQGQDPETEGLRHAEEGDGRGQGTSGAVGSTAEEGAGNAL